MAANPIRPDSLISDPSLSISQRIAEYVTSFSYSALPESVCARAKLLILDTLAVAWAGAEAPGSSAVHDLVVEEGGRPVSTVWGSGQRLPVTSTSFLNGMYAVALDYDAFGTVHADAVTLPAAIALAERERVSGRDFLTAYIIGTDLCHRLGGSITGLHKGWSATAIYGVFGVATTAAKLLRLNASATCHALGIALSQAAGTQQGNIEQTLTKRMQPAFAARAGVWSALLAARGITAPRAALEGKFGLYELYQAGNSHGVLEGLGRCFNLENTMIKKYPICACGHAALEAMIALVQDYDLEPDDVIAVEVSHSPFMHRLVGAPFELGDNLQVTAQNSVRYAIASALLRRRLGIAEIQDAAVLDPSIMRITERVRVVVDERNKGTEIPATVSVETKQHGTLTRTVDKLPWGPSDRPGEDALQAKFEECFTHGSLGLKPASAKLLAERVGGLESLDDMGEFFTDVFPGGFRASALS
jgi:2-methylcitrate dehydratase PrpD